MLKLTWGHGRHQNVCVTYIILQFNFLVPFYFSDSYTIIYLFIYLFYLYIYPPDSQKSDGGVNT